MSIAVIGFIAMFLAVFLLFVLVSRVVARRSREREDRKAWDEGQRRRAQTEDEEAWKANRKMPMK
jgi:flagellar biosynthesis/type III secretory pathway M-ring protein FliF/YscJ